MVATTVERALVRDGLRVCCTRPLLTPNPISPLPLSGLTMPDLRRRMSDLHEADLSEWFGGRGPTPGSGNQFNRPMDGRVSRYNERYAFAWDGKSTRGESIGVSRSILAKIVDQAGGERPMLPLRFYSDDRLRLYEDWVVLRIHDLLEILDATKESESPDFEAWLAQGQERGWISEGFCETHDMVPMTEDEISVVEDGGDPCIPALRVWAIDGVR